MLKQLLINKYFHKLCKDKFFKNDEDAVIGSAKNVIQFLKENITYANEDKNIVGEEWAEYIISESYNLIEQINKAYKNKNNIVGLFNHPMSGYYILQEKQSLFEDLKEYYDELKEDSLDGD